MKDSSIRDRIGRRRGILLLTAAVALPLQGQSADAAGSTSRPFEISAAPAPGEVVREIDDPHTGERWLLLHNEEHPGEPGRLVLAGVYRNTPLNAASRSTGQAGGCGILPVIRAGDRLIVEEHTAVVDAVLEARALNPAAQGSALDVRLTIGGKVMRAVAIGPGRAELRPQGGVGR